MNTNQTFNKFHVTCVKFDMLFEAISPSKLDCNEIGLPLLIDDGFDIAPLITKGGKSGR